MVILSVIDLSATSTGIVLTSCLQVTPSKQKIICCHFSPLKTSAVDTFELTKTRDIISQTAMCLINLCLCV